jgi:ribosomal protein S3AE
MLTVNQVQDLLLQAVNFFGKRNHERRQKNYSDKPWYSNSEFKPETELHWGDVDSHEYSFAKYSLPVEFHGRLLELVESDTGGEGHGEDIHMVFKTTDVDGTEQYWRKEGCYTSYDGSEWDGDFREVRPVERVVTFYE